jgi:phosphoglycolate phosphatase
MNKNIVFFDLDGTLTNPFEGVAKGIEYALEKLSVKAPPREDLRQCIGPPLHVSFARLLDRGLKSEEVSQAIEFYREYYSDKGLFENELYDGVVDLLKALSSEVDLYVATSKPQPFAEHVLEYFNLDGFFKGVCGSELDGGRSDKSEIMNKLIVDFNLKSDEITMIGDRLYDIEGAKKNNLKTIGVLWGFGNQLELVKAGADHCVKNPKDIIDVLKGDA